MANDINLCADADNNEYRMLPSNGESFFHINSNIEPNISNNSIVESIKPIPVIIFRSLFNCSKEEAENLLKYWTNDLKNTKIPPNDTSLKDNVLTDQTEKKANCSPTMDSNSSSGILDSFDSNKETFPYFKNTEIGPDSMAYLYFCDTRWGPYTHTVPNIKKQTKKQKSQKHITNQSPCSSLDLTENEIKEQFMNTSLQTKEAEKICRAKNVYLWLANAVINDNSLNEPPKNSKEYYKYAENFALNIKYDNGQIIMPLSEQTTSFTGISNQISPSSQDSCDVKPSSPTNPLERKKNITIKNCQQTTPTKKEQRSPYTSKKQKEKINPVPSSTSNSHTANNNNNVYLNAMVYSPIHIQAQLQPQFITSSTINTAQNMKSSSPQKYFPNIINVMAHSPITTIQGHYQFQPTAQTFTIPNTFQPGLNLVPLQFHATHHFPASATTSTNNYFNAFFKETCVNSAVVHQQQQQFISSTARESYVLTQQMLYQKRFSQTIFARNQAEKLNAQQQQQYYTNHNQLKTEDTQKKANEKSSNDIPFKKDVLEMNIFEKEKDKSKEAKDNYDDDNISDEENDNKTY